MKDAVPMSIAITDEHRALAQTVSDFLDKNGARAAARALLDAEREELPSFWREVGELGWLGLAVPEEHGGSGFGLPELVIVAEEMGRAGGAGGFVAAVAGRAVMAAAGSPQVQARLLPGLADGSSVGAAALGGDVRVSGGTASGSAGVVLGGHLADVLVVSAGDDIAIVNCRDGGVSVQLPANLDPARLSATRSTAGAAQKANWNTQVHAGTGLPWEHDAHLYLRRATAIEAIIATEPAAIQVPDSFRKGVRRERAIDLPTEAEPIREVVREFIGRIRDLGEDARRKAMIEAGYVMPNWPKPWGRDAGAVEQLVIEQEFGAAGIRRPSYGITSWVILTLIQYGTAGQVERWVVPALNQEMIWCQLFSEPGAGSDAAGIRTRATKTDGGWLINGQKVWTSGAQYSRYGLGTVRTHPDPPQHHRLPPQG